MSWKLRHAGSPQVVTGLTAQQIVEGLADDDYEPGDEVMGPDDKQWVSMDEHPHFDETVELYLESQEEEHVDHGEDHIDMNPLIDVCLVLLVIFIMAQSMAFLEKVIEAPKSQTQKRALQVIKTTELPDNMVMLVAEASEGRLTIKVENSEVTLKDLPNRLKQIKFNSEKKDTLVVKHKGITHGTMISIVDAAAQAGIRQVKLGADTPTAAPGAAPPPN